MVDVVKRVCVVEGGWGLFVGWVRWMLFMRDRGGGLSIAVGVGWAEMDVVRSVSGFLDRLCDLGAFCWATRFGLVEFFGLKSFLGGFEEEVGILKIPWCWGIH